jgi:hypothetical protein
MLRVLVVALPLALAIYLVLSFASGSMMQDSSETTWFGMVIATVIELVTYQRIGAHVRAVALGTPTVVEP